MFTEAFTDPQGTSHEAAVFQVLRSEFTGNTNQTYNFDVATGEGSGGESYNFSLNYRMAYWPSQEAKDAGGAPYILIDPTTYNSDFASYSLDPEVYNTLSAEQAAEEHCRSEVIGVTL